MEFRDGQYDIDLTVELSESPEAEGIMFVLLGSNGMVAPGSTVPDAPAALAAVERFGEEIFFPEPRPDRICTQQYGGPQVAVVSGWFHDRPVSSRFSRTDGCEIARWKTMAPLLGGMGGAWGGAEGNS